LAFILRAVLLIYWLLPSPAYAQQLHGLVVGIADGDTITVLEPNHHQHKIRLSGIDAPEKSQPFGQKSKASLSAMVFKREVEVIGNKTDRYGRTIAKVMAADPNCNDPVCPKIHDVGLMQVMSGMAWWYRRYAKEQTPTDREDYEVAELNAKARQLGLWADRNPTPPWDWRHR
jgi:endonuclease YncB( thermonuclease family)